MPKTVRDELYDIIAQITSFSAETEHRSAIERAPSDTADRLCRSLFEIEKKWEYSLPPPLHKLMLDVSSEEECNINLHDHAAIDTILLKLEFTTARLLFALLRTYHSDSRNHHSEHVYVGQELKARRILTSSIFRQHSERSAGILESHCRSLFTIWILRQLETREKASLAKNS